MEPCAAVALNGLALLAQSVEQPPLKGKVEGSIPSRRTRACSSMVKHLTCNEELGVRFPPGPQSVACNGSDKLL